MLKTLTCKSHERHSECGLQGKLKGHRKLSRAFLLAVYAFLLAVHNTQAHLPTGGACSQPNHLVGMVMGMGTSHSPSTHSPTHPLAC